MSPGRTRLLAQGPLLTGAPVIVPRVPFKSELGPCADLGVLPSDPGSGFQIICSLNNDQCSRGCRPERSKREGQVLTGPIKFSCSSHPLALLGPGYRNLSPGSHSRSDQRKEPTGAPQARAQYAMMRTAPGTCGHFLQRSIRQGINTPPKSPGLLGQGMKLPPSPQSPPPPLPTASAKSNIHRLSGAK